MVSGIMTISSKQRSGQDRGSEPKKRVKGKACTRMYRISSRPGFEWSLNYIPNAWELRQAWPNYGAAEFLSTSCLLSFPVKQPCPAGADNTSCFRVCPLWSSPLRLGFSWHLKVSLRSVGGQQAGSPPPGERVLTHPF